MEYEIIGRHAGGNIYRKGMNLVNRSLALMQRGYGLDSDVAVSFNQYAQIVAAFLLGIPSVTTMDYEYQPANHLSFRLARRIIVPEFFPDDALRFYGASSHKVRKYPGLKEEVYLSSFRPDTAFLQDAGLDNGKIYGTKDSGRNQGKGPSGKPLYYEAGTEKNKRRDVYNGQGRQTCNGVYC